MGLLRITVFHAHLFRFLPWILPDIMGTCFLPDTMSTLFLFWPFPKAWAFSLSLGCVAYLGQVTSHRQPIQVLTFPSARFGLGLRVFRLLWVLSGVTATWVTLCVPPPPRSRGLRGLGVLQNFVLVGFLGLRRLPPRPSSLPAPMFTCLLVFCGLLCRFWSLYPLVILPYIFQRFTFILMSLYLVLMPLYLDVLQFITMLQVTQPCLFQPLSHAVYHMLLLLLVTLFACFSLTIVPYACDLSQAFIAQVIIPQLVFLMLIVQDLATWLMPCLTFKCLFACGVRSSEQPPLLFS